MRTISISVGYFSNARLYRDHGGLHRAWLFQQPRSSVVLGADYLRGGDSSGARFAIPLVLGAGGYLGGSLYVGTRLGFVLGDTWHVMGFTLILYLLVAFLVGEARRTASIAHAFARIAGVVANASSSSDAMAVAKKDILASPKRPMSGFSNRTRFRQPRPGVRRDPLHVDGSEVDLHRGA
ncbi:MAG: hypothetical protein R2706_03880 [Acidimicrobiales bacterium]